MHVSETPLERGQKPQDFYEEGQHIRAAILRIEDEDMKIGLSSRDIDQEAVGQVQVAEPAEEAPAPPSAIEAARAPQFREAVAPPAPVEISDVEPEAEAVPQAEAIPSAEPAPEPPAAARIAKPARTKAAKPAATKAAKPPAKKKAAATTKKKAKSSGSAKSKSK